MYRIIGKLHYFGLLVSFGFTAISLWVPNRLLNEFQQFSIHSRESTDLLTQNALLQRGWSLLVTAQAFSSAPLAQQSEVILQQAAAIPTPLSNKITEEVIRAPHSASSLAHQLALAKTVESLGVTLHEKAQANALKSREDSEAYLSSQKNVLRIIFLVSMGMNIFLSLQIYVDVRNRKLTQALESQQKLQSLLFASLKEGVILCDPNGKILSCNESASALAGIPLKNLLGKTLPNIFPQLAQLVTQDEFVSNQEFTHIRGGVDARWLSVNSQPLFLESDVPQKGSILSITDITEKVGNEREAQMQKLKTAQNERLRVLGEMAGGIAHEINNPIGAIGMAAQNLERVAKQGNSVESGLITRVTEKIVRLVQRSSRITQSMLRLTRNAEHDPTQATSAAEILQDVLEILGQSLRSNSVTLTTTENLEQFKLECQPTQIAQVLMNLIKNAIESFRDQTHEAERTIAIEVRALDDGTEFSVTDNGPGIPKTIRDRILEPFFTTKPRDKGTGLGLSISRTIAEKHGGKLYLDESSAQTRFVLFIPKQKQAAAA